MSATQNYIGHNRYCLLVLRLVVFARFVLFVRFIFCCLLLSTVVRSGTRCGGIRWISLQNSVQRQTHKRLFYAMPFDCVSELCDSIWKAIGASFFSVHIN